MTEDRGQRTDDRGQKTEVRSQRSEDRSQRTDDRILKWECGLRPVGAIEAYAPEGRRNGEGIGMVQSAWRIAE